MGKHDKLRDRIFTGTSNANIGFTDLCALLIHDGFQTRPGSGSHRIFWKEGVDEIINLQPRSDGKAKPYQVKQVSDILRKLAAE